MPFRNTLFFRVLLPFGISGGVVLLLHTLFLAALHLNPLGGYRDLDLLVFVLIVALMLVRYNFVLQKTPLFWEVFLSAYICFMLALLVYLLLTMVWLLLQPEILTEYASLKQDFVEQHKTQFIENLGIKGYLETLQSLQHITPKDIFLDQLAKKSVAGLVITAFLAILFRLTSFMILKKKPSTALNHK